MVHEHAPKKILVIGNSCSGKTVLSKKLSLKYNLPVLHVDSIQFQADLKIRPIQETLQLIEQTMLTDSWIIDGFGPLDNLIKRLDQSDLIIYIDRPLWIHYALCAYRQIKNVFSPRSELPQGCNEVSWRHTNKLFDNIHKIHYQMRPEMLRILSRYPGKVQIIK